MSPISMLGSGCSRLLEVRREDGRPGSSGGVSQEGTPGDLLLLQDGRRPCGRTKGQGTVASQPDHGRRLRVHEPQGLAEQGPRARSQLRLRERAGERDGHERVEPHEHGSHLPPQTCASIYLWFVSNVTTGLSYEARLSFWAK